MKTENSGSSDNAAGICVFPYKNGWTVACGSNLYSFPLSKEEATTKALLQARKSGVSKVAIVNESKKIEAWVFVEDFMARTASDLRLLAENYEGALRKRDRKSDRA